MSSRLRRASLPAKKSKNFHSDPYAVSLSTPPVSSHVRWHGAGVRHPKNTGFLAKNAG